MKQFHFSLATVLHYKQQVLEALQAEHAECLLQVRGQEQVLFAVQRRYQLYNEEYRERKRTGMKMTDALCYQGGLHALELDIRREAEQLKLFRAQEEQKRRQVVEARKDTSSLEKLREKKRGMYQKEMQRDEELLIEEFVSSVRSKGAS